jgi:plasmid stabilization system protein ParE
MKWTVLYRPSAQNQLANIWLSTPDQQLVADAADEIDRLLASNPMDVGESRGGNTRIIIERPLTVLYDVYPDDALVEVFAVFYWRRRKR